MNQNWYRKVVSGQKNGIVHKILRGLFAFISWFYKTGVKIRNFLFDHKIRKPKELKTKVISIGNITTGGTGKTPMVMWLCNYISEKGLKPGVLTRGYKAVKGKLTDEPAILTKGCSNAKVVVDSNRYQGGKKAISEFGCDVIVMDDGFQHRQLKRDLDIVTIDATCPFGYNKMLPAGLLREPKSAIKRAQAVVITRFDQAGIERIDETVKQIKRINPDAVVAKASHKPIDAVVLKNKHISIEELKEKRIFAFCGIGNPDAFLAMLKDMNLNVVGSKIYNDHHNFTQTDIQYIYETARYLEADVILSTQKDWVKTALLSTSEKDADFAYLAIEIDFASGREEITGLIDQLLQ